MQSGYQLFWAAEQLSKGGHLGRVGLACYWFACSLSLSLSCASHWELWRCEPCSPYVGDKAPGPQLAFEALTSRKLLDDAARQGLHGLLVALNLM